MIATDHAPHSLEEKSKGLAGSSMGVVGLECAFSVMYTEFVKTGIFSLERLIDLFSINPRNRFMLHNELKIGNAIDICVFDPSVKWVVNPEQFYSKGRSTPFNGREVFGEIQMTIYNGEVVYANKEFDILK